MFRNRADVSKTAKAARHVDKLAQLRKGGAGVDKWALAEEEDDKVYDEMDEEEYAELVKQRREDDFIEYDDEGYSDGDLGDAFSDDDEERIERKRSKLPTSRGILAAPKPKKKPDGVKPVSSLFLGASGASARAGSEVIGPSTGAAPKSKKDDTGGELLKSLLGDLDVKPGLTTASAPAKPKSRSAKDEILFGLSGLERTRDRLQTRAQARPLSRTPREGHVAKSRKRVAFAAQADDGEPLGVDDDLGGDADVDMASPVDDGEPAEAAGAADPKAAPGGGSAAPFSIKPEARTPPSAFPCARAEATVASLALTALFPPLVFH